MNYENNFEENKNNSKKRKLKKNYNGIFSFIEDEYTFILKELKERKKRLKKMKNFSTDYNTRNQYNFTEGLQQMNKNLMKKSIGNYYNDRKKLELDEYPFKKENKTEQFTFKNNNPNNYNEIDQFTFKNNKPNNYNEIEQFTFKKKNDINENDNLNFKLDNKNINIESLNINNNEYSFKEEKNQNYKSASSKRKKNNLSLNNLYSETSESLQNEENNNLQSFLTYNKLNDNLNVNSKSIFSSKYNYSNKNPINRYLTEYLESVNNEHCNSFEKLEYEKLKASNNIKDNLKILEEWIKEIKDNNSQKEKIVNKKKNIKKKLNKSVFR